MSVGLSAASIAMIGVGIAAVGVGVSMYGASEQADAQKEAARYQTEAGGRAQAKSNFEAEQIWKQTIQESNNIRSHALYLRGSQVATQAASGVLIGDGSSQAMLDETTRLAEMDVMSTLYNGARGVLQKEEEGRLARESSIFQSKQLYSQAQATMIGATGSALTTLGSAAMGAAGKMGSTSTAANTAYGSQSAGTFGSKW